jgi:hypothetical protein
MDLMEGMLCNFHVWHAFMGYQYARHFFPCLPSPSTFLPDTRSKISLQNNLFLILFPFVASHEVEISRTHHPNVLFLYYDFLARFIGLNLCAFLRPCTIVSNLFSRSISRVMRFDGLVQKHLLSSINIKTYRDNQHLATNQLPSGKIPAWLQQTVAHFTTSVSDVATCVARSLHVNVHLHSLKQPV